jgi:predicted transport protein
MENSLFKHIINDSLENSYKSDPKNLKVVDFEIGSLVLGIGMSVMTFGNYKEDVKSNQDQIKTIDYKADVSNPLTLIDSNVPVFLLVSNDIKPKYQQFLDSFESHFIKKSDGDIYRYSFDKLAKALANLQYKKAFVDVDPQERRVDFYLNIGHKILLTVSQVAKDVDDDQVMFAIEQNHETIAMDRINLKELIGKIQHVQLSLGKA